ncbi:iron complex transport system substrate-binding protein [Paenibacillus sp. UNCCL117]|uniref:ABC transporter substrate-binding protein n=1 Tax=unclassified Paenibacillus TaxID=185978 RepID=UPI00087F9C2B|nr:MULTISPECIES: iron-siderophore ABC transporter substrate-binding protein [unclassified Paenibacillus]SDE19243.1 iron complex transport system substrate-binding protein [Paenibacillus sp. cl123]SFW62051.1 iron complex transport system substrate-binding protein [Paenibacillus sp. UNCCL117]
MKALRLGMALLLIGVLAACGSGAAGSTGGSGGQAGGEKSNTGAPAPSDTGTGKERTIQHAMGTAKLSKQPERVVVLFNGMVDNAVALGVKPVGAVESWEEKPWYKFLRDKMDGVKNLGEETQPNLEAIIALKPDLIIGAKSRHEKIYPQLSGIAPTVMTENVFDWKGNLKLGADALYKEKEAGQLLAGWDKRVAEFKQKAGASLSQTEISIIRFEGDGSARLYVTGFAGSILQELGLSRPKSQQVEGKTVVNLTSKEQMGQLDGDYIFDITRYTEGDASRKQAHDAWTSHPLWSNLKGVKAGKYIPVDVITWNLSAGALAAQALLDDLYKHFQIK